MPVTVRKPRHPSDVQRGKDKFGISPGYLVDVAYRDDHLDVVQDLGATWVRIDFNWAQCEPSVQGTFDWTLADALVAACRTRGLRILGNIGISTPAWARSGGGGSTLPTDPFDMALFGVALQNRYPDIRHWEIGNEINLGSQMSVPNVTGYGSPASTNPSGKAYAFLMRAMYPRMKVQDPDCVIITAGLAGTDTSGSNINEVELLLDFYDYAGQNYCDAVGAHPYSQPLRGGELLNLDTNTSGNYQTWSAWGRMSGYPPGDGVPAGAADSKGMAGRQRVSKAGSVVDVSISSIRQVMTTYGDSAKKIWITEVGAHTGSGGVTQAEQVEQVKRAYAMAQTYDWVGPVFWYSAKDLGNDGAAANSWGLVDSAGVNKTAYATYQQMVQEAPA